MLFDNPMEKLMIEFPELGQMIFSHLTDHDLRFARLICRKWKDFIVLKKLDEPFSQFLVKNNYLHLLQWAHNHGCSLHQICNDAAELGNLEILKWAIKMGYSWDEQTCCKASRQGHLQVLKWLIDNGCSCNIEECIQNAMEGYFHLALESKKNGFNNHETNAILEKTSYLDLLTFLKS